MVAAAYAEVTFSVAGPSDPWRLLTQSFSYSVPAGLSLQPGDAVLAPFGSSLRPGIVYEVGDQPAYAGIATIRELDRRLGDAPLLPAHLVRLAQRLVTHYLAQPAAAIALMLPRGSREPADFLAPEATSVEALTLVGEFAAAVRALAEQPAGAAGRALRGLVALGARGTPVPCDELRRDFGLTAAAESALLATGYVTLVRVPAVRSQLSIAPPESPPDLTVAQQHAVDAISDAMRTRFAGGSAAGTFLLHGVTGSGKTEVYLAALQAVGSYGRQGIVLVPEIALTPQMLDRFASRFPDRVAVMHGRLGRTRQREQWFGARSGRYDVVVGARSALFAPLPNPGLIVLDEEHEPSYKQSDPAPRYHAREAAIELARLTGAVLVLGRATPDVGTYRRVERGEIRLLSLPRRYGRADTVRGPACGGSTVQVVDMARELREGHQGVLSRPLDAALAETLTAGGQALLFLNRRGTASLLLCRDCGHAPRCPRCSVTYALHAAEGKLICHQCHHSRGVLTKCPLCRSARIRPVGIGTQRLEEIVRERFPEARVLRWDGDTATTQKRHEQFRALVADREVDLIVGTQMVAKGHDFPGIALVGAVSADLSLNLPDFRAAERTFQLLVQVAGRAGRRDEPGRVFIQTYAPDHYAIRGAAASDYVGFYEQETAFRRRLAYPPFAGLTRLVYSHTKADVAEAEAKRFATKLATERERLGLPGPQVVGPAPCYLSKLGGRYRWQILLRGRSAAELLRAVPPEGRWAIDVDPLDLL